MSIGEYLGDIGASLSTILELVGWKRCMRRMTVVRAALRERFLATTTAIVSTND